MVAKKQPAYISRLVEMTKDKGVALIEPKDQAEWEARGWKKKGDKVHVSDPTLPDDYVPPTPPTEKPKVAVEEKPDWHENRVGPGTGI